MGAVEATTAAGLLTTPPGCPSSGAWMNKGTFDYHDGVIQEVSSASACKSYGHSRQAKLGTEPPNEGAAR